MSGPPLGLLANRADRAGVVVAATVVLAAIARYASGFSARRSRSSSRRVALAGRGVDRVVRDRAGRGALRAGGRPALLQSTLGNLPEFFVVLFALQAGQLVVAETAILGSILVNALLVLGLVIVAGARRAPDGVMRFSPRLPNDTATLLLIATLHHRADRTGQTRRTTRPATTSRRSRSSARSRSWSSTAIWVRQYLHASRATGPKSASSRACRHRVERRAAGRSPGSASAFVSDWFVHALEPTIHTLHISQAFAGLVIVAIAGNAVENVAGIVLAAKGQSELAISVVKNSVAQIAAFLYPLLVLVSLLTATTLTFALAPVYIGALFGTAVIVWQITGDGEATLFEGCGADRGVRDPRRRSPRSRLSDRP